MLLFMADILQLKEQFLKDRNQIFTDVDLMKHPFQFCIRYSVLVEEYIQLVLKDKKLECAVASVGSFSRRELSPYSDIDIMFIYSDVRGNEEVIKECITELWDFGIEVSHTIREQKDIKKFLKDDLHAFTQFFETRFIIGNRKIYDEWIGKVFGSIKDKHKKELIKRFVEDTDARYIKYGDSAKVLEPNVKFTAGGLRDLQVVEWIYSLKNDTLLVEQSEITQTEFFLNVIRKHNVIVPRAVTRLLDSYRMVLDTRNILHLISGHKNDRLEFTAQEKIAKFFDYGENGWHKYMKRYFEATNVIKRFHRTMMKRFEEEITSPISDFLSIDLDEDFVLKGSTITRIRKEQLTISSIMRGFYYRGLYDAQFDESLRSDIIEAIIDHEESQNLEMQSSVFFREILRLSKNVGKTLSVMNELGVIGAFLSEFKELIGFFQPGVYHCYTADEHTLIALNNVENLSNEDSLLGKLFSSIKRKDLLYLSILFHDIAKPISISGHEIIGAEVANSVMERLGYDQNEIILVQFLVRHHLTMEQVAFRRNLNDPVTLNNFVKIFPSSEALDFLYLLTFSDLSAVSPVVWTQWKGDLLYELYRKTQRMLEERISGEELLSYAAQEILSETEAYSEKNFREHIDLIDDIGYLQYFSQDEINQHIEEIEKGSPVSVFFKEESGFTNVTVITRDSESLLSKLCGALSINDLNIHDAKIFTRKDGIVIDSFNVTDFRTGEVVNESRHAKITSDVSLSVANELQITKEFSKIRSKWWRIENKLFKRKGKIKIEFEKHDKYTIIDVYSPDRLGLLYQVAKKMNELSLSIYFAKIATKADDVVDAFYVLDRNMNKISPNDYQLITLELTETIEEML